MQSIVFIDPYGERHENALLVDANERGISVLDGKGNMIYCVKDVERKSFPMILSYFKRLLAEGKEIDIPELICQNIKAETGVDVSKEEAANTMKLISFTWSLTTGEITTCEDLEARCPFRIRN